MGEVTLIEQVARELCRGESGMILWDEDEVVYLREARKLVKMVMEEKQGDLRQIRVGDYDPACSLCREQAGKSNANTGDFLCNAHALAIGRAALRKEGA